MMRHRRGRAGTAWWAMGQASAVAAHPEMRVPVGRLTDHICRECVNYPDDGREASFCSQRFCIVRGRNRACTLGKRRLTTKFGSV